MITDPKKISFESPNDVIDYVSRGLPPSKKHYNEVMEMFKTSTFPDSDDKNKLNDLLDEEITCINDTLDRIYENRKKERNAVLGCIGLIVAGAAIGCFIKGGKKKDDVDISSRADLIEVQDIEVIEI